MRRQWIPGICWSQEPQITKIHKYFIKTIIISYFNRDQIYLNMHSGKGLSSTAEANINSQSAARKMIGTP